MNEGIVAIAGAEALPPLFAIYRWGIDLIKVIQTIKSPPLTAIIKAVTIMGSGAFYIPAVLFVFWCVDEKKGMRLGTLIILSGFINSFFKLLFKQPRPFNLEPPVGLAHEPSFGFPSGHAQVSVCFWFPCARWYSAYLRGQGKGRGITAYIAALCIVLIIGFTRLYLGVHFPTDLLGGWLLGVFILVIYFQSSDRISALLDTGSIRSRMIIAAAIALGMNALLPADRSFAALFLGFTAGYCLMLKYFPFSARAGWSGSIQPALKRVLRCALGLAGAALVFKVLSLLLPGETSLFKELPYWGELYELGRFIRYGILGLWASAGAPWFFLRLGLAEKSERS
jgi:membrane-associated phospholipid phosphatase